MSRFTRFRDSVRMSHDWPRRAIQAARHGDSAESLFSNVPGHRGFTSQLDSFLGNDKFWDTFSWAVPRVIGGAIGSQMGGAGVGTSLGGMLASRDEQTTLTDPSTLPAGSRDRSGNLIPGAGGPGGSSGGGELLSLLMGGGGARPQQNDGLYGMGQQQSGGYLGGYGLI